MKRLFPATMLAASLIVAPALAQAHDHDSDGQTSNHHAAMGHAPSPADIAAGVQVDDLMLSGAFARATLPRAPVGGAFVTIVNQGSTDDRLISAAAPVGIDVQIHEMAHAGGVMTMRELADGLLIPAGSTVTLAPGGYHLMVMGLTEPLVEGQSVTMELTFEKAGPIAVDFAIQAINAQGAASEGHSDHGGSAHGAMTGHDHGETHSKHPQNGH